MRCSPPSGSSRASGKPIGALDDDPSKHGADLDGVPVLGGSEVAGELTDAAVVVCMAHARRPTGRLSSRGGSPCPMIDGLPSSTLCGFRARGQRPGAWHGVAGGRRHRHAPIRIGAHVVAMPHVLITHDDKISDGVTFTVGSRSAGPSQSASARTSDRAH